MAQEKITIKFEAVGQPALVQAINGLTKAQYNLKNGIVGATNAGDHAKVQSQKLSQVTLRLTAQLAAQGKTWTDIGVKTSIVSSAMRGNQVAIEKLRNSYKTANTTTRILGGSFAVLRSKLLLVSFASTMVATTIGRLTKLFGEQEKAEKKLEIQLGGVSRELLKFASAQQQVTRFGDEVTISAMATAAAYTKNTDEIERITKAAMDYAIFSDKDLNTAIMEVSKSVFSSTNLLNRQGIAFEGAVDSSQRFDNALEAIAEKAGGLAEGEAATLNFALNQMNNAVGDLGENLGTVFVPLVMASAKGIKAFAEFMDENRVKSYTAALFTGATAYGVYAIATGKAAKAMVLFNKISKKNLAVMAAFIIVGELIEKFELFGDETDNLSAAIDNLNNGTKITLAQQQELDLSSQQLLMTQKGLSDLEIQRELNQVKLRDIGEALEKGTVTQIEHDIKRNQLLIEQIGLEKALMVAKSQAVSKGLGGLASLNQATKGSIKVTARLRQAQAIIDAWAAYNVALASAPPPFNMIAAAGAIAAGMASVRNIQSEMGKFEQGGLVGGRRHSQGGTMIEAEQGEFVMRRDAVESIGIENLNRMNQGGGGGAINVSVSGNVLTQDFVEEELAEAIKEAVRRGTDFGIS
mgnify:FL=1|tara:strand:- start:8370 stop:10277 length:1908 start_codon:yes stop_codon:yes gene_type:complete